MALTWVVIDPPVFAEFNGQKGYKRATVQFDSTYPAGGEAFVAADAGMSTVTNLVATVNKPLTGTTTTMITWDKANSKLQLWESGATGTPLLETDTVDQSALVADVLVYGKLA